MFPCALLRTTMANSIPAVPRFTVAATSELAGWQDVTEAIMTSKSKSRIPVVVYTS
jgi:hypothetical protein